MAAKRVMLVDDSPLFIASMKAALDKEPDIEIAGTAANGQDALDKVGGLRPDVIVCDVNMPRMSGIEFVKALLPRYKIPVVVISSTPGVTLQALAAGAVDFIPKPQPGEASADFFRRVVMTVRTAATANVGAKAAVRKPPAHHHLGALTRAPADMVVAIGASTGGTDAILAVVRDLPADFPGVLATQHMPPGFTAMYAERLNRECKMRVLEAREGMRVEKGLMILAAGEHHMRLRKDASGYFVTSRPGMKVNGHVPSVEVLFESVAEVAGKKAVGIILTGMGGDGAEGLLKMRQAGAYTIGQDKATSVVYGMPMMAYNKGAVMTQLPLDEIPDNLIGYLNRAR